MRTRQLRGRSTLVKDLSNYWETQTAYTRLRPRAAYMKDSRWLADRSIVKFDAKMNLFLRFQDDILTRPKTEKGAGKSRHCSHACAPLHNHSAEQTLSTWAQPKSTAVRRSQPLITLRWSRCDSAGGSCHQRWWNLVLSA